jgi:hypothetical protein
MDGVDAVENIQHLVSFAADELPGREGRAKVAANPAPADIPFF